MLNLWYLSAYDEPLSGSCRSFDYAKGFRKLGINATVFTNNFSHYRKKNNKRFKGLFYYEKNKRTCTVWLQSIGYKKNNLFRLLNILNNSILTFFTCLWFRLKEAPEYIIAPSVPISLGYTGYLISKILNCKFIFEVRDVWPQALVDLGLLKKDSFFYKLMRYVEQKLYKKAYLITTVLINSKQHIKKSTKQIKKIIYIPNGFDEKNMPSINTCKRKLVSILYAGGFANTHDPETIIKTAKLMEDKNLKDFRFYLVGSGPKKNKIKKMAEKYKLKNVKFLKFVNKKGLVSLMAKADILISCVKNTKVYQFGINSNKLIDYLSIGKPIIFAGKAACNPIKKTKGGFCIPPENPILLFKKIISVSKIPQKKLLHLAKSNRSFLQKNYGLTNLTRLYVSFLLKNI